MKIYTNEIDIAKPMLKRFWTAPHSDFKLGVKIVKDGVQVENEFSVKAGSTALVPDEGTVDGFTTYTLTSGDSGFVEYTVTVVGVAEKMKIVHIVTDSTVFEVGGTGGGSGDSYTKAQTDALLSAKADNVKQVPITTTYWETTGWTLLSTWEDEETMEEHEEEVPFTKKTSDFIDISQYCDWTVSAQYVSPNYATDKLFISECTNGKSVYAIKMSEDSIVFDVPEYEGQFQSGTDISGWFEFDQSEVPDGSTIADAMWNQGIELSNHAIYAYVSENMDGSAPYQLQDLGHIVDVPFEAGRHAATEHSTTEYVEVSAVYSNEISGAVDEQYLSQNYYSKNETSSAIEISTALEGKQPAGNYISAETDPTFHNWLSGDEISIGHSTQAGSRAIAMGYSTKAYGQYSVAIGGPNCYVASQANSAIQLGSGYNGESNTFKVFNYQMLSSDGKIPNERLHLSAVSESDWATLSGSADAGTFYFVY